MLEALEFARVVIAAFLTHRFHLTQAGGSV